MIENWDSEEYKENIALCNPEVAFQKDPLILLKYNVDWLVKEKKDWFKEKEKEIALHISNLCELLEKSQKERFENER